MILFASNDNELFPKPVIFEVVKVHSHFLWMAEAAQDVDDVIIDCVAFCNKEDKGGEH